MSDHNDSTPAGAGGGSAGGTLGRTATNEYPHAVHRRGIYPIAPEERHRAFTARDFRAVWTGEKRQPRKGEWFLSGNPVEAYRAPADLAQPYHIAQLVRVKTVEVIIDE